MTPSTFNQDIILQYWKVVTIITCVGFNIIFFYQLFQIIIIVIDIFSLLCLTSLVYRGTMFYISQYQVIIPTFYILPLVSLLYQIRIMAIHFGGFN